MGRQGFKERFPEGVEAEDLDVSSFSLRASAGCQCGVGHAWLSQAGETLLARFTAVAVFLGRL